MTPMSELSDKDFKAATIETLMSNQEIGSLSKEAGGMEARNWGLLPKVQHARHPRLRSGGVKQHSKKRLNTPQSWQQS